MTSLSEQARRQLELIDSGVPLPPDAPPLLENANGRGEAGQASLNADERKQEIAADTSAPPSIGIFQTIFNSTTSLFGDAAKQTASVLSSLTGFFTDLFTNKSSVPEQIIPIKSSASTVIPAPRPSEASSEGWQAGTQAASNKFDNPQLTNSTYESQNLDSRLRGNDRVVASDITRREVLDLIKQYDDNSKALIYAANAATGENSLTISQSISGLEKKISNLQYVNSRQLDKPASIVSRSDADIKNISGAAVTDSTITSSSFSGTTGTFTGNLSGATGSFSGLLTLNANLLMSASAYLNFGTDSGSSGYGVRDNGGTIQFKNSSGSWTTISPTYWSNNGSSIYYNDGNIGISTSSPYAKLSVVGETVSSYFTATTTTASTFPYASTTALTVSGSAYIGSLNGPIQANNGLVSATTSVGTVYGGTGINSSALTGIAQIVSGTWSASSTLSAAFGGTGWNNLQTNTVLLGNGAGRLATTSAGTDGYVLALSAGVPTWLATSTLSTITGTLAVTKGGTGQTSFGQGWLNSNGTDLSASTSPTVNYIVATSTTATSTFPYLSVTTNSNLGTVVGGTWQGTAIGDAYLTKSGDWTGTLDTYEASSLLARANHTGTQGVSTLSNYDWTFSNNYGALNLTGTSTKPIWAQGGINASSTSNFVYASTTALTISGNSYLGTISSGAWNGTAIGNAYVDDDITLTNLTQITNRAITDTTGTLTVARGGTGQTSFGQGWLNSNGTDLSASTSPTVNYITATSTTATSTFAWGLQANALNITSTSATSTFARGIDLAGGCFAINGTCVGGSSSQWTTIGSNIYYTAGNIGIGTTTPWSLLSLKGSSGAQMTIAQADTNYTQLTVDASGNLTLTPSGSIITIPDDNLKVCAGDACQTTALNSGNGNLTVENNIEIGGNYNRTCASGYVWVPGSAKFGTLPGFCVMKYEAKNDGSNNAVSTATGGPYVSIDQPTSRSKCEAVGLGYHLISEPEWMTIAENIAQTTINDMDDDAGLQLATGHSDNAPSAAQAATSASNPVVSGCNLSATMENAANAYSASSCEIQGDGSYGGDDNDKGFYGTSQAWAATGYSAGAANKSQLRTHVLSNGNVIWDIAGNVWEWTDAYVNGTAEKPTAVTDAWQEWTAVTNYLGLNYARPQNPSWASANGIGQYYAGTPAGQRGFLRGGYWGIGANDGVFTLILNSVPSFTDTSIGFRCAR